MTPGHRFGRFEIQPLQRALLIDGKPATVGSRAFDLLLVLVEHRDRLVTKDELLDRVWPGLVVEENNIAVHVSALRRLLGPDALLTIPGRGYRFVARPEDANMPADAPQDMTATVLPAAAGPLVGRERDRPALVELLREHRCVTVIGPGGVGKTSLALAAAHETCADHRDGACWVELGSIGNATALPAAVASAAALGIGSGESALSSLIELLNAKRMLVVLDNAEHLVGPVSQFVQGVLARTAGVRVLVTSQVPLRVPGEQLLRLEPLSLPFFGENVDEAVTHGSLAMLVEHARANDRRFALSRENLDAAIGLCRGLGGLPLAIRLAAARLPLLGLHELAARLSEHFSHFRNMAADAPSRQQTLYAALDWSCGLLQAREQRVLRRLAVFSGGFPLDVIGSVAGDAAEENWRAIDSLGELVDRSLVDVETQPRLRYRLLDVVRVHARRRLDEAAETETVQRSHALAYAAMMDAAYEAYWASADAAWLDMYAAEIDNVRAALDWSARHDKPLAVRLASAASVLFMLIGQAAEGRRRLEALAPYVDTLAPDAGTARYWLERSRVAWGIANASMLEYAQKAQAQYRSQDDARGRYLALRCIAGSGMAPAEVGEVLSEMAMLEGAGWSPRLRAQRLLAEAGLLLANGDLNGDLQPARGAYEGLLRLAHKAGLDSVAAAARVGLAQTFLQLDQPEDALACAQTLLAEPGARRGNLVLHALMVAADAHVAGQRLDEACQAVAEFLALSRSRDWEWLDLHAPGLASFAAAQGRIEVAARLIGYADAAVARLGPWGARTAGRLSDVVSAAQSQLGESAVLKLRDEGAGMRESEICAMVLPA